jgi:hypothetical protein
MALDFSKFLDVDVSNIEAPKPIPVGHYFATIKGWKGAERDYAKATGGAKTPVVELTFSITGPDEDVDEDDLPPKGVSGRLVQRDYSLNEESGVYALRRLGEETCGLDVKGLHLSDLLDALKSQEVKLYIEQRAGAEEGQFFPQVKKVLPVG